MRRLLLVLALAAGGLVTPWMPRAQACSCAGDATQWLPQADAAFVGALVSRDPDPPPVNGVYWSGTAVLHHYEVGRVVKGDIASGALDVWGTTDGASCGLGTPIGQQIGLLLRREGDRWTSNLCSIADPDALVQAAQSPSVTPDTVLPAVLAGSADARGPDRRPLLAVGAGLLVTAATARAVRRRRRGPKPTVLA